jgi:hypothetical protein
MKNPQNIPEEAKSANRILLHISQKITCPSIRKSFHVNHFLSGWFCLNKATAPSIVMATLTGLEGYKKTPLEAYSFENS